HSAADLGQRDDRRPVRVHHVVRPGRDHHLHGAHRQQYVAGRDVPLSAEMAGSDHCGPVVAADPVRDRNRPGKERPGSRPQASLHRATFREHAMTGFTLPPLVPGFADLHARLDGPRMWKHLEVFDRWTKYSGSSEERESLKYVEA